MGGIDRPADLDQPRIGRVGLLKRPRRAVDPRRNGNEAGHAERNKPPCHRLTVRKRKALPITSTELRLIAALAMMGLSRMPQAG